MTVHDVYKAFGDKKVLDGVSLEISAGTVYALLGQNGAGKTTLVNIISTLVEADYGDVFVAGADARRDPAGVHRAISLTGQFAAIDDMLTGRENLEMFAALLGVPGGAVDEQLANFDLIADADVRASKYSGGMRRRLDLAVSLLRVPEVLVLDEPTTGLDTRSRHELWASIRRLASEGLTVLLTTQDLEEADALADRIGVLHNGRIVAEGTAAQLKASVGDERVVLVDSVNAVVAERATDGTAAGLAHVLRDLGAENADHLHVRLRQATLDDVFLALTGTEAADTAHQTAGEALR